MNGSSVVTRRSEAVPLSRPRMTAKAPFIMESESGRAGVRLLTGRCRKAWDSISPLSALWKMNW